MMYVPYEDFQFDSLTKINYLITYEKIALNK